MSVWPRRHSATCACNYNSARTKKGMANWRLGVLTHCLAGYYQLGIAWVLVMHLCMGVEWLWVVKDARFTRGFMPYIAP